MSRVGLLTALDLGALTAYVTAWSRYVKAEQALAALAAEEDHGGMVQTTANGNAIQHVLVGVARRASSDVVRTAAAFGMTPASRAGVEARPPIRDDDTEFFS
jgi:P27 family predicted phage terminase small subunit